MKNKQRLTAMLLAGCLAVSSVPVAFAEDAQEQQQEQTTLTPEQQQKQVFALADQAREDSKAAAPTEGTCGENATWKLEGGTLTISGTGEMSNYGSSIEPWYDSRSSITRVVIELGITSLGDDAFSYCSSLTSVTISSSVTSIGNAAFKGCSSLSSMTIPNSVMSIGDSAFEGCGSLSSVTIPDSVTSIGGSAFEGCSSLSSVTIPNSVMSIGGSAFEGCNSLSSVTIPDSVTSIGAAVFSGCSSLSDITVSKQNKNYSSEDGVLFNKNKTELVSYPSGKNGSYRIPNSVTGIGNSAFEGCSGLGGVTIPDSVTSIGSSAFSGCSSLSSVTIPGSVTSIGSSAFEGCSSLSSVTIPNSVTSIGDSAFENCSSLSSVTIPNSITEIPYGAFAECENLINVTIPDSVASIGSDAFFDCSNLISITIPDSVTSIGEEAFSSCVSLKNVVLSNSITVIRRFTFSGCESLTEIYIPDGVTYISMDAFSSTGLKSVTIPSSVTEIEGWAFEYCQDLTSVTIPDSVECIGKFAFLRCPKLKNIVIPANTSVDVYAFGMDFYSHGDTEEYYVIDDFVATVTEGSDGERYCKENGIKYETSHSFTNYVYNNDAQVGKDGTETATCDNGCGTTDTRIKKGTALPEPTTSVTELFCDVPSSAWYVDYVQFVYDNGLMNGTSETTFEPETTLSRAMVAQILYNHAGRPEVSGQPRFSDVSKDQWYYNAVQWASEQGIVSGIGDGKFAPNDNVTREQLAMMLYNAQGKPETDVSLSGFEDINTISDWAVSAVKWAVNEKIINGSKENEKLYINPMGNATRAEAATMFTRYDQEFD